MVVAFDRKRVRMKRNIAPSRSEHSHTGKRLWGNYNKSTTPINITKLISANQRVMIQNDIHQRITILQQHTILRTKYI